MVQAPSGGSVEDVNKHPPRAPERAPRLMGRVGSYERPSWIKANYRRLLLMVVVTALMSIGWWLLWHRVWHH